MTLLQKYRATKDLISSKNITIPIWDLLIILDMANRAPALEAELRYLESFGNNIDRTASSYVVQALATIDEEGKKQQGEVSPVRNGQLPSEIHDLQESKLTADVNGKDKINSQTMQQ